MSLAFGFGMVGVVAGGGASLYLSASAAGKVAQAEAALERQRQKARDLEYGLQTVAVDLNLFAHENQGLVWGLSPSFIFFGSILLLFFKTHKPLKQKEGEEKANSFYHHQGVLMHAIIKMLTILDELTNTINELITYFSLINNEIRNLVAEHESEVKKIAQDKANGIEMEDGDYKVRIYNKYFSS